MNHEARPLPRASAAKRGIGYLLTLSLLAVPVLADRANSYSTRAQKEFDQALSADAYFGIRAYTTTASLPTCNALRGKGAPFAYDVEAAVVKVCNGTSWTAVGSSTITSGTTATSGCTAGGILHSVSNLVVCSDTDLTFVTDTLTATKAIHPTSLVVGAAAAGAANAIEIGTTANTITFERSSDAFQMFVTSADATVGDQTWTIPNAAGAVSRTFASLEAAQTFSGQTLWSASSSFASGAGLFFGNLPNNAVPALVWRTESTPDSGWMVVGPNLAWNFGNLAQVLGGDMGNGSCGTGNCVDPTFTIHSINQNATEYSSLSVTGAAGGWIKALTGGSATAVLRIPVASGAGTGGTLFYTIFASDATDHQTRSASVRIAVENKAGTEVCGLSATSEVLDLSAVAVSAGTLTYTIACSTTPTNAVDITFNAVSSLTETTLNFYGYYNQTGPGLPARQ